MSEKVVTFGPNDCLVGIAANPAFSTAESRPCVLFWNVGLLHRVGPQRLYVDMARALNALGFPTLRFDLSGIGDSPARRDRLTKRERVLDDIRQAMNYAQKRMGADRFILVGLCSGADDVHGIAPLDERVCGAVLIDGYGYPTTRFLLKRYLSFLSNPKRVFVFASRKVQQLLAAATGRELSPVSLEVEFGWSTPPREEVQSQLQAIVDRPAHLLFIYSGDTFDRYNYDDQFRDMFPGFEMKGRVEYDYMKDADHLFSLPGCRERLETRICNWAQSICSP